MVAFSNGMGMGTGDLQGRVALVTGAARGIGRAIALDLACRHASVAVNYRTRQPEAQALADQIRRTGTECILVRGDAGSPEEAGRIVQEVLDAWGRLDILVNNAGIKRDKSTGKAADDQWADAINVDLNATCYCTNAALPVMIRQRFGRIINVSPYVREVALGPSDYAISKGGVIGFTKTLAAEVAKYNITVNTVAPGFTKTEMLAKMPENVLDQIRARIPLGRFAQPEEVARAVGFLAAQGDYITGQQLNVNGGLYI